MILTLKMFDFGLVQMRDSYRDFMLHYRAGTVHMSIWLREDLIAKATEMRNKLQAMSFADGSDLEDLRIRLLHKVIMKLQQLERNEEEHCE